MVGHQRVGVIGIRPRAFRVAHIGKEIKPVAVLGQQQSPARIGGRPKRLAPRRQRSPVVAIAVHRDRTGRLLHIPARCVFRQHDAGHHQAARHGARRRQQRLRLALAQQRFHLSHIQPASNGKRQRILRAITRL
ncbi:MAG: hypothetical protein WDW36_000320 [Sanguina aurantia]